MVIHTKQLLLIPFSKRTIYFSTLITADLLARNLNKKTKSSKSPKESSYTISYLMNSCGLSPECAKKASERVNFGSPSKPDSVIKLLKIYGFNDTHLSLLVRKRPTFLLANPEKNLLPKLDFYNSIGFSKPDIGRILSHNPVLLSRSLENRIVPAYKFLKTVIRSDRKVISLLRRSWGNLNTKSAVPNVTILRKLCVPASSIELLTVNFSHVMFQRHEKFREAVDRAKKMEFDPLKSTFVLAIRVLSGKNNKLIWNRCFDTYKKWGWSEDDILSAFKKHPHCMTLSVEKINKAMDVFVNKMGFKSEDISETPSILLYDVEKRIVPRCLVIQVLISKGLLKEVRLCSILMPVEKIFLEKFVTKYDYKLPQLMSVYRGGVEAS